MNITVAYLQNITYHSNWPHISSISYSVKVYNFRRNKFWGAEQNLKFLFGVKLSGQSEIYDFDSVSGFGQAQDVFGLKMSGVNAIVLARIRRYSPSCLDAISVVCGWNRCPRIFVSWILYTLFLLKWNRRLSLVRIIRHPQFYKIWYLVTKALTKTENGHVN